MAKETESNAPGASPDTLKSNEIARSVLGSGVKPEGFRVEFRNGTATVTGSVASEDDRKRVLDKVRSVAGVNAVTDSMKVGAAASGTAAHASTGGTSTYTVKSGDTLSKIAKEHYGDASAYTRIFEANRNILSDPDKIQPGQELKMP